jgi:hypothetical protein
LPGRCPHHPIDVRGMPLPQRSQREALRAELSEEPPAILFNVRVGVRRDEAEVQPRGRSFTPAAPARAEGVPQPGKTRQGRTLQPLHAIPRDGLERSLLHAANIAQGLAATRRAGSESVWGIALQSRGGILARPRTMCSRRTRQIQVPGSRPFIPNPIAVLRVRSE